ncbi:MAG: hypothetical protein L0Y55_10845 [Anaerolineales bacterium]|nr:hypothetical protein [Anaerolineales bacterium]
MWNEGSAEDRQRIMKLVLERAWVQGEDMIALWIRPQYLIWVREGLRDRESEKVEPANLPPYLLDLYKKNGNFRLLESYRCGSDGFRFVMWQIILVNLIVIPNQFCCPGIHFST